MILFTFVLKVLGILLDKYMSEKQILAIYDICNRLYLYCDLFACNYISRIAL